MVKNQYAIMAQPCRTKQHSGCAPKDAARPAARESLLKIAVLTKEFPPHIYGGAGVHIAYLTRELARLDQGEHDIHVWCFGDQDESDANRKVTGIRPLSLGSDSAIEHPLFLDTLARNVAMLGEVTQADLIHCHTWYTHLAGCLLKPMLQVPLVLTTHSLEPRRPWKKDQLGSAYHAGRWLEKTAYQNADGVIAVSEFMKADVRALYDVPEEKIEVIHNGIDDRRYRPRRNPKTVAAYGIDASRPYILMVSRLTRQKGIPYFLEAVRQLNADVQIVLCASVSDTREFMQEISYTVSGLRRQTGRKIIWITQTVPPEDLAVLYTHADIFVCPSIYEPFGIINLEAMACGTPVVASAVGGIPEVVVDGKTGRLVPFEPVDGDHPEPQEPQQFARDLAKHIDSLLAFPEARRTMGQEARRRIETHFSWKVVAEKTLNFYKRLVG